MSRVADTTIIAEALVSLPSLAAMRAYGHVVCKLIKWKDALACAASEEIIFSAEAAAFDFQHCLMSKRNAEVEILARVAQIEGVWEVQQLDDLVLQLVGKTDERGMRSQDFAP
jgi:hypothetical protein